MPVLSEMWASLSEKEKNGEKTLRDSCGYPPLSRKRRLSENCLHQQEKMCFLFHSCKIHLTCRFLTAQISCYSRCWRLWGVAESVNLWLPCCVWEWYCTRFRCWGSQWSWCGKHFLQVYVWYAEFWLFCRTQTPSIHLLHVSQSCLMKRGKSNTWNVSLCSTNWNKNTVSCAVTIT